MPTLPLSRRWFFRIARLCERLDEMVDFLDALPDRTAPLPHSFAGRFRRTLNEGRALLGLPRTTHLDGCLAGVEFFLETMLIWQGLSDLKAARNKATPRAGEQRYPPLPAPW